MKRLSANAGRRPATNNEKNHESDEALVDLVRRLALFDPCPSFSMVRYEVRSEAGRLPILEITPQASRILPVCGGGELGSEIWRVHLEAATTSKGKRIWLETGSWPIVPTSRAQARFV